MSQSSDLQYYFICSHLNGFVLGIDKNNDIVNQPKRYPPIPAQQWYLQENGGFTTIFSKLNGQVATLPASADNVKITASPNQQSENQKWCFKLDAPTSIASAKTGLVFDVFERKQDPDTPIIAYRAKSSWTNVNQQFQFEKVRSSYIISRLAKRKYFSAYGCMQLLTQYCSSVVDHTLLCLILR